MAKISDHFDTYEFRCTCGCGKGAGFNSTPRNKFTDMNFINANINEKIVDFATGNCNTSLILTEKEQIYAPVQVVLKLVKWTMQHTKNASYCAQTYVLGMVLNCITQEMRQVH